MPPALAPGCVLGRYQILAPIARGGMAQVWAARLHGTRGFQRIVALKTISAEIMDDAQMVQLFLQEATLASQIQHPNVAATLDLGEQDGMLYMVMEWVEGEPLTIVLERARRQRPIPLAIAVNLVAQACQGLHGAHELCDHDGMPLGIVHRDVSPHNVMVTHAGIVKLVDFGIAKATNLGGAQTEAGEVRGKFAYMAPEQIRGEALDRRTDIFALGILLYLLTTGRHPHKGESPAETIHRLCARAPARPSDSLVNYPPALETIVLKALAKDKNERFADARMLFEALARAQPQAFQPGFEAHVAHYLEELIGDRGTQSKAQLRLAQRALDDAHKGSATAPGSGDPASVTSLRALVVDSDAPSGRVAAASETHRTLLASSSSGLHPRAAPRPRTRAPLLALAATALAATALAAFVAPRWSRWNENRDAMQAPAPAVATRRAPEPPIVPTPITAPASASAPPEPASANAATPPPTRPKARREPARARTSTVTSSSPVATAAVFPPPAPPASTWDPLQKRR